tara:strand:- start:87 stop:269 length:183 start_codon:yes stop_codon:yes gene_type:complete
MWRCMLWSCTAGDREKLILCGADEEKTKRFAMRDSEGKFEGKAGYGGMGNVPRTPSRTPS